MTNDQFFEIYKSYNSNGFSRKTCITKISLLKNHFLPLYGDIELNSITPGDINKVYEELTDANYSPCTVFGTYAALSVYFKLAIDTGNYNNVNPVSYSNYPRYGR